jgi:hypothetical protein
MDFNMSMTPRSVRTMITRNTDEAPIAAPQFNISPVNSPQLVNELLPVNTQPSTSSHPDSGVDLDHLFIVGPGPIVDSCPPDPIYPLQRGQTTNPTVLPPLNPYRSQAFYLIFKGQKIRVFYNYWYVLFVQSLSAAYFAA